MSPENRLGDLVIAVSGLPGTGTTTLSHVLSDRLGAPHVYAGALFRALADEHGMSLAEFGAYAETHEEVDRELDNRMVEAARVGGSVLEGRMSVWQVGEARARALRVLLVAPLEVRAKRLAEREGKDLSVVLDETRARQDSEAKRYREIYGVDPNDPDLYDLVIDSSQHDPEGIADIVTDALDRAHPDAVQSDES